MTHEPLIATEAMQKAAVEVRPFKRAHLDSQARREAPLCDFPVRDEMLYQFLQVKDEAEVMEIGPGSGYSAFWMAEQVRSLTLVDIAAKSLHDLALRLSMRSNIHYVEWDLSRPGLAEHLGSGKKFDAIFGLDMFEFVSDPAVGLRNAAEVLRPGGMLLLSFPNQPPEEAHGVNSMPSKLALEQMLTQAGFRRWELFSIRLHPMAQKIFYLLHEVPIRLQRRLRRPGPNRPLDYDATWAFQHRSRLERLKPWLHLYWALLGVMLRIPGPAYVREELGEDMLRRQVVIRAWR